MLCSRHHLVFAFMIRYSRCTASYSMPLSCIQNWAYILKIKFVKKIKNINCNWSYWMPNFKLYYVSTENAGRFLACPAQILPAVNDNSGNILFSTWLRFTIGLRPLWRGFLIFPSVLFITLSILGKNGLSICFKSCQVS